ncbi:MAG: hypothetical protein JSU74_03495 [Candidatus Zixiibacteriota bacterium]|nr:MAG: hypothetical protein JSU74_03495 [candidate division Zixibacteria bacterium]
MTRKLVVVLPALFVLVFAFTLVVSLDSTARASGGPCGHLEPITGCCIMTVHCGQGIFRCGYGVWNGEACIYDYTGHCPSPASCPPPP